MLDDPMFLWAKKAKATDKDPLAFHPLLCHLLDVGAVATRLWSDCLPLSTREWVARQLGLDIESAGHWTIFLAASHDYGKSSKAFFEQARNSTKHGTVSTYLLQSRLIEPPFGIEEPIAKRLARVVGGHHGAFPRAGDLTPTTFSTDDVGYGPWEDRQGWLIEEIARLLGIAGTPPPTRLTNAAAAWLAGFISVADWIGSNRDFFPYAAPGGVIPKDFSSDDYAALSRERAARAIAALGWSAWPEQSEPRTFADLFPDYTPNVMQEKVIGLAEQLREPFLVLIEAPMGMGKTEAALYLADHATVHLGMRGHYLALPTQATSNQMFSRDTAFLKKRYPNDVVNTQLLHGHAALDSELKALRQTGAGVLRSFLTALDLADDAPAPRDAVPPGVIAAEWFTYRKRGLLAPFGVGTIDQALLSVLQTKHFFVRLLGLAGKTVIFDEVHAYDTYMSVLLERLMTWLHALGCSVILLSATLPATRRGALLRAWTGEDAATAGAAETYPAIAWRSGEDGSTIAFETDDHPIRLRWLTAEGGGMYPELGADLEQALAHGGCAAVICNTVKRAQEVYQSLKPHFTADELSLFHARFLYGERNAREGDTLRRFGKPGEGMERPYRAVIVATQILEQSLDLDFDLMVTELAPVDLVLQRVGRLHRHRERDRPPGLDKAELWLLAPPERDGLPVLPDAKVAVYHPHIQLRSWLALRDRATIVIPKEIPALIEEVYDDALAGPAEETSALRTFWDRSWEELQTTRGDHESKARTVAIYPPSSSESGFLEQPNQILEEDDPGIHKTLRALTRLGEPSLTAIVLTPEEQEQLRPRASDAGDRAAELLVRSVSLSRPRAVVDALVAEASRLPPSWKRSALLRHCRLVELNDAGTADIAGYHLRVEPDLGVVVD